jgi:hypothetical protein
MTHARAAVRFEFGLLGPLRLAVAGEERPVGGEKLRALLALPARRRHELGAAARRAAVARWSWGGVAERLLEPLR